MAESTTPSTVPAVELNQPTSASPPTVSSPPTAAQSRWETMEETRMRSDVFSATVRLQVGASDHFIVHKTLLEKVRFFGLCLRNPMQEGLTDTITLPEDDLQTVQDMLGYLYFGKATLDRYNGPQGIQKTNTCPASLWQRLHKLYTLAEKLAFEDLQNDCMDVYIKIAETSIVPTWYLTQLEADLRSDCQLVKFWTARTARYFRVAKGFGPEAHVLAENRVLEWVQQGGIGQ